MMRKLYSVGLAVALALCVAGTASAATTIDLVFSGPAGTGTVVTITPGFGGVVTANLFMTTNEAINIVSFTVLWDTAATVATSATEWFGLGFAFPLSNFVPIAPGVTIGATSVGSFDGAFPPPSTQVLPAGTYQLGTIVFDDAAGWVSTVITLATLTGVDGVGLIGGVNISSAVFSASGSPMGTINVVPEPATASLLGLGLIGLIVAGRRKRA